MSALFGSSKQETTIPEWVAGPARQNIANAQRVASLGYTPYYGPDVAAFTPMQEASFQNTSDAMAAFGMAAPPSPMAGMPEPQTFANGVRGWSSAPMYEAALEALKQKNPAQYNAIMQMMQRFKANATARPRSLGNLVINGGGGAPAGAPHSGGSFSAIGSYLPGGVNTLNPSSAFNQAVALMTSGPTTVSASSRPESNPRR